MPRRVRTPSSASVGLAFLMALLAAGIGVHANGASLLQIVSYLVYVALFLTLPGILVWRLLWTGGRGTSLEHAVFGTLMGAIVQLPVYAVGLMIGFPRLTVAV